MFYPPSGYIIFCVRKIKFYEGRGLGMKAKGQGPDNPNTQKILRYLRICQNHTVSICIIKNYAMLLNR